MGGRVVRDPPYCLKRSSVVCEPASPGTQQAVIGVSQMEELVELLKPMLKNPNDISYDNGVVYVFTSDPKFYFPISGLITVIPIIPIRDFKLGTQEASLTEKRA
jgi:hypothetical protein